ncbi:MAG: ABC transporter permease [Alishewanella aestuarii]
MFIFNLLKLLIRGQQSVAILYSVLVAGIAISVVVLCWLLALKSGFQNTVATVGHPQQLLLLKQGANNEAESFIEMGISHAMSQFSDIKRRADNSLMISPEIVALAEMTGNKGVQLTVLVRGVMVGTDDMRPAIHILQGRAVTPGSRELLIGARLAELLGQVKPGDTIELRQRPFRVAGIFSAAGSAFESELLADAAILVNALGLAGYQSVRLRVTDINSTLPAFRQQIARQANLRLDVLPEQQFFRQNAAILSSVFWLISNSVGILMTLAAALTAASGMLFLADKRRYIIGLFRASGFSRYHIGTALLLEGSLIAAVGLLVGVLLSLLLLDGSTVHLFNLQNHSQLVFSYQLKPVDMLLAALTALAACCSGALLAMWTNLTVAPCRLFRRGRNG